MEILGHAMLLFPLCVVLVFALYSLYKDHGLKTTLIILSGLIGVFVWVLVAVNLMKS